MAHSIRTISDLLLRALLMLALLAAPAIASAEKPDGKPAPAAISPPAEDAPQVEHFEYWQARGAAARERVAEAQAVLDEANAAVSRMRRRNHPRGEARIRINEERDRARAAYDEAVHFLEVELPAEARAAGAPRHWLIERTPSGRGSASGRSS
ncbi:MAG: hypothetical protein JRG86_07895 [Deltaproteobacteria bacterium]|jgi:hypothetical protein|nr:hypothetical protein [Deltaproteobacteria bacterium]MBW2496271.1 hypothetical protein [Deltaproteobacteria bacterium]